MKSLKVAGGFIMEEEKRLAEKEKKAIKKTNTEIVKEQ